MGHELFSSGIFASFFSTRLKRAIFWAMVVWLPPVTAVIIARLSGEQIPQIGLFQDFAFHVRCLMAMPLLVLIEKYIFRGTNGAIPRSMQLGVLRGDKIQKMEQFRSIIYKWQSSYWTEAILLMGSLFVVYSHSYIDLTTKLTTWRTIPAAPYIFARMWNQWIGLTLYYYFILRWFLKFNLWSAFLIRLALLKPQLESLHPDLMGGISYLSKTQVLFGGFASAFSAVAAANISSTVLYGNIPLESFYMPMIIYGVILACFFVAPLAVFTPHLLEAKRKGLYEYSFLCSKYSALFRKRWFNENQEVSENLLGVPDLQSLNDLMGSYSELKTMRVFALNHRLFLILVLFIGAPLLPLFLFKVPLKEVMAFVIKHII